MPQLFQPPVQYVLLNVGENDKMSWVAECGATLGLVVKPVSLF